MDETRSGTFVGEDKFGNRYYEVRLFIYFSLFSQSNHSAWLKHFICWNYNG